MLRQVTPTLFVNTKNIKFVEMVQYVSDANKYQLTIDGKVIEVVNAKDSQQAQRILKDYVKNKLQLPT
jgi:hypothetical protein